MITCLATRVIIQHG